MVDGVSRVRAIGARVVRRRCRKFRCEVGDGARMSFVTRNNCFRSLSVEDRDGRYLNIRGRVVG